MIDKYAVLGVSRTASTDEIRKAYRKLALQLHPDRNPGDEAKEKRFKEISAAYSCLSDPRQREIHNRELNRPTARPVAGARNQAGPIFAEARRWYRDRHDRRRRRKPQGGPTFETGYMEVGKTYPLRPGPVPGGRVNVQPGMQVPLKTGGIPIIPLWRKRKP